MIKKRNELNLEKTFHFIEELSWLLDNYKGLKLEDAVTQMKEILEINSLNLHRFDNVIEHSGKHMRALVGIFPELFQNKTLFPTNQSIIEFANEVLQMNINPFKNRSKTETIGEIVCSTYALSNYEVERVVCALNKIISNDNIVKNVKEMKKDNTFSWNEVIQRLAE